MKVLNNMTFRSILYNKWKLRRFILIKNPLTLSYLVPTASSVHKPTENKQN